MKYLLLLICLLLTACDKKEVEVQVNIDEPKEVVIVEKPVEIKEETPEIKEEEEVKYYKVNIILDGNDSDVNNVVKILDGQLDSFSFEVSTMPYLLPELDLGDYDYSLSYYVDGEALFNKTTIYENYNAYDAVKVIYKDKEYYAYLIKGDLLFATVDERNRVIDRKYFDASYNYPITIFGSKVKVDNNEELYTYLNSENYYNENGVTFTDSVDIVVEVSKKEVKETAIKENNDTLRHIAVQHINRALDEQGFKEFIEYDNETKQFVNFDFVDFNTISNLQIPRFIYGAKNDYIISCTFYVNDRRTTNVNEALLKEAKQALVDSTNYTVDFDISYEIYHEFEGDKVSGVVKKQVTMYRNN